MKKILVVILIFFFNFILKNSNCYSQWVLMDPLINAVNSITYNGTYIFIGQCTSMGGVYTSSNMGLNWVETSPDMGYVYSLASNSSFIYAGYSSTYDGAFYVSSNNGNSWDATITGRGIGSILVHNSYILAATYDKSTDNGDGVWISSNNGYSWNTTSLNKEILCFTSNGNYIFAGGYGVYSSSNNGTTWVLTSLNNKSIFSLASSGSTIFAGELTRGVYKSTNNGSTWIQTSLNNKGVYSLAVSGSNIFAGTSGNGIYFSSDGGSTWVQKNEGIGSTYVESLIITSNYVFAGATSGIWRRPLNEFIGIKNISTEIPFGYKLEQNYPNPFNPKTNIRYQIAKNNFVLLEIFDLVGRVEATLVNEKQTPGTYEAEWDATQYPSGIYFYRLEAGDFTETKKMVIIK